LLKFSTFLYLIFSRWYTKVQENKTMGSSGKNKQGRIGKKINPMLPCLFLPLHPMVLFFSNLVYDVKKIKLRNAENFNEIAITSFEIVFPTL
jgi:cytochrome c biogenesis factor